MIILNNKMVEMYSDKEGCILIVAAGGGFPQLETVVGCSLALQEIGILRDPNIVYGRGTSAGAIGLTCLSRYNWDPLELHSIIWDNYDTKRDLVSLKFWWWLGLFKQGYSFYNRAGLEDMLYDILGDTICLDVIVSATNSTTLECDYFYGCRRSVLASSSIQKVFPATRINSDLYWDGGYCDNVPMEAWLANRFKKVYIILPPKEKVSDGKWGVLNRFKRSFLAKLEQEVNEAERIFTKKDLYPNCVVLRPPPQENMNLLGWSKNLNLIETAKQYTKTKLTLERK